MADNQIIEEIIYILKENAVLLAVLLYIILMVVWGYKKGLMAKLLSLCSVAATLIIEARIYPMVLGYIKSNEAINRFFSELGMRLISGALTSTAMTGGTADTEPEVTAGNDIWNFISDTAGSSDTGTGIMSSPLYRLLGLDKLADNAVSAIGDVAVRIYASS